MKLAELSEARDDLKIAIQLEPNNAQIREAWEEL
jgi:hypothetical protein